MKIGDKINTPIGLKEIVSIELYTRLGGFKRYCVKSDNVNFPVLCYFEDELKIKENNQQKLF